MHRRLATRTVHVFGLDRHVNARQVGGKRTAIGATLFATRPCGGRVRPIGGGFVRGKGLLDIFERKLQLLGVKLLRTPAKLRALQLAQQMPQAIDLRQRMVALDERRITLRTRRRDQRMERFDIGRKLICDLAHDAALKQIRTRL
jgi:hypothetical protein